MRSARRIGLCAQQMGVTLLELMFVVALAITMMTLALPSTLTALNAARAEGAARYMAGRLRLARMEAVKRSRAVALRFERTEAGYQFAYYVDGNNNGVRNSDVRRGVDRPLWTPERIQDNFPGVRFGILDGVTAINDDRAPETGDPIRIGSTDLLSFTANGTATPGTLYLSGRGGRQYAVRVLGATGRTRVLRYNFGEGQWLEP